MTRQERIAALEAQLANSRKRRSELGQSLGLDRGGNAGAVALEIYENGTSCSLPPSINMAASMPSPTPALLARSDLSPSPEHGVLLGASGRDMPWSTPLVRFDDEAGISETALRAELRHRTKHVSELQAKLAEATRQAEQAGSKAQEGQATQMRLAMLKTERDRRIEVLETLLVQEKRNTEVSQEKAAEWKKQCDDHEDVVRMLRLDLHQKTVELGRIHDQFLRQLNQAEAEKQQKTVEFGRIHDQCLQQFTEADTENKQMKIVIAKLAAERERLLELQEEAKKLHYQLHECEQVQEQLLQSEKERLQELETLKKDLQAERENSQMLQLERKQGDVELDMLRQDLMRTHDEKRMLEVKAIEQVSLIVELAAERERFLELQEEAKKLHQKLHEREQVQEQLLQSEKERLQELETLKKDLQAERENSQMLQLERKQGDVELDTLRQDLMRTHDEKRMLEVEKELQASDPRCHILRLERKQGEVELDMLRQDLMRTNDEKRMLEVELTRLMELFQTADQERQSKLIREQALQLHQKMLDGEQNLGNTQFNFTRNFWNGQELLPESEKTRLQELDSLNSEFHVELDMLRQDLRRTHDEKRLLEVELTRLKELQATDPEQGELNTLINQNKQLEEVIERTNDEKRMLEVELTRMMKLFQAADQERQSELLRAQAIQLHQSQFAAPTFVAPTYAYDMHPAQQTAIVPQQYVPAPQMQFQTAHMCTCSLGHQLLMITAQMKWGCNMCQSRFTYNPRLRCNECDFDICNTCAAIMQHVRYKELEEVVERTHDEKRMLEVELTRLMELFQAAEKVVPELILEQSELIREQAVLLHQKQLEREQGEEQLTEREKARLPFSKLQELVHVIMRTNDEKRMLEVEIVHLKLFSQAADQQRAREMDHIRVQCSAIRAELSDILGDTINEHSNLARIIRHHEDIIERLSTGLYASEKSRHELAAKVQKFELDSVRWVDQTRTLTSEKKDFEAALDKCTRESNRHKEAVHAVQEHMAQVLEEVHVLREERKHLKEELEINRERYLRMQTGQQQVQPLRRGLESSDEVMENLYKSELEISDEVIEKMYKLEEHVQMQIERAKDLEKELERHIFENTRLQDIIQENAITLEELKDVQEKSRELQAIQDELGKRQEELLNQSLKNETERFSILQTLMDLTTSENDGEHIWKDPAEMTPADVVILLSQVTSDRKIDLETIEIMASQLSEVKSEIGKKNLQVEVLENMLAVSQGRILELEMEVDFSRQNDQGKFDAKFDAKFTGAEPRSGHDEAGPMQLESQKQLKSQLDGHIILIKQIEEELQKEEDDAKKQIEEELRKEGKAVLTGKEGVVAIAAEELIEARNVYNNNQVKSISRVLLKAKQEIERLREDLKVAEAKLAKQEKDAAQRVKQEEQLQLQIYGPMDLSNIVLALEELQTALKDAEAEKSIHFENAKKSKAEADEIRKELRNVSDIAFEIYRDFDNELELLKMALGHVESKKIRACETEVELLQTALGHVETEKIRAFETAKTLQAEANDLRIEILQVSAVVQTIEESLKQLHTLVGHALVERMVSMENAKKSQAEMDELRNELEFYLKEVGSIRQELEMRLGVEAEVEFLHARIAELQQQLAGCHRKAKEDTELIEVLRVKLEDATERTRDTDRKLLETEFSMLACVAEEARLVEELQAGLSREKKLEQELTMLQEIRRPEQPEGRAS